MRVLIADDQELVRTGFRVILNAEPDIEVVGEAGDGREAIEAAAALRPDVVLMDIRMPNLDGIEATRRIAAGSASSRVLILTTFDLDKYVYEALRAGASGFLLKDAGADESPPRRSRRRWRRPLLAPSITRGLIEDYADRPAATRTTWGARRADAARARSIARSSPADLRTPISRASSSSATRLSKTHVARIFAKLDLHDRAQAVVLAYESGPYPLPPGAMGVVWHTSHAEAR
jgi:DNA-binding NarL/FixJ family response regulator